MWLMYRQDKLLSILHQSEKNSNYARKIQLPIFVKEITKNINKKKRTLNALVNPTIASFDAEYTGNKCNGSKPTTDDTFKIIPPFPPFSAHKINRNNIGINNTTLQFNCILINPK